MAKVPKALANDPIVQCLWEVRFETPVDSVAELLPGMLFSILRHHFDSVETLPVGEMPRAVRSQIPNADYQASKRLVGKSVALNIADRSVVVDLVKPYWGWDRFKALLVEVAEALRQTNLVSKINRTSLRYVNILPDNLGLDSLAALDIDLAVPQFSVAGKTVQIRFEVTTEEYISIVQIVGSAETLSLVDGRNKKISGMLVDVDTVTSKEPINFWGDFSNVIEGLHSQEKDVFFSLLTEKTVNILGPKWN